MASICLITPSPLSTNPRLVKEADALHAAGHKVTVITTTVKGWARTADREFESRAWHSRTVLQFGPGTTARLRLVQIVRQRTARLMLRASLKHPKIVGAAWHPVEPDLVRAASAIKADLYIAHYPAALRAAALAAAKHGGRYAVDAEDFHLGDPPPAVAYDNLRASTRAIESRYLDGCAYVSAASPGIADAYVEAYGIVRPTVVLNVFPLANAPSHLTSRGVAAPGPSVYWFSQTIGADRGLECAVAAIGIARAKPHLYVRGNPSPGFIAKLQSIAATWGAENRLHILPPGAPAEMERLAAAYDLGLVAETGLTPNRRIALTNKLFSYALAGVPALISDIPAHRTYAEMAGAAVRLYAVGDSANLACTMDQLLDGDSTVLAAAREHAFNLGQHSLNWDNESKKLLHQVDLALAG